LLSDEDLSGKPWLSVRELARLKGVEKHAIYVARRDGRLPAVWVNDQWMFERAAIDALGENWRMSEKKRQAALNAMAPSASAERILQEGKRDARVIAELERNLTIAQVVMETNVPQELVIRIREMWLRGREIDRKSGPQLCGNCSAPSDPQVAFCTRCFGRARVLNDAERLFLAREPIPPPNTCTCHGCNRTVRNENAEHLCAKCMGQLTLSVQGGSLVIALAETVVRRLTLEETRKLMAILAPPIEVKPADKPEVLAKFAGESNVGESNKFIGESNKFVGESDKPNGRIADLLKDVKEALR
jgi:Zn finger protein HypA/HybF involved in hydrogenase expression